MDRITHRLYFLFTLHLNISIGGLLISNNCSIENCYDFARTRCLSFPLQCKSRTLKLTKTKPNENGVYPYRSVLSPYRSINWICLHIRPSTHIPSPFREMMIAPTPRLSIHKRTYRRRLQCENAGPTSIIFLCLVYACLGSWLQPHFHFALARGVNLIGEVSVVVFTFVHRESGC